MRGGSGDQAVDGLPRVYWMALVEDWGLLLMAFDGF